MDVFPIYLNRLNSVKTVLIGGDHEAERKVGELLERKARLTVISPELTDTLHDWAEENRFEWIPRGYQRGDLSGAFMAIVAEFEGDVNKRVYDEAQEAGILVNVMDDIPHCNFAFGSIIKRGPLTISISTSGAAPAFAVRLRERFESEFGEEYEDYLTFLQSLRKPMKEHYPDFEQRKRIWYELVDSDILSNFRNRDYEGVYKRVSDIAGPEVIRNLMEPKRV